MKNGEVIEGEKAVANAHIFGARPFMRNEYIRKFKTLTDDILTAEESNRFLTAVQNLKNLTDLSELNVQLPIEKLTANQRDNRGIF